MGAGHRQQQELGSTGTSDMMLCISARTAPPKAPCAVVHGAGVHGACVHMSPSHGPKPHLKCGFSIPISEARVSEEQGLRTPGQRSGSWFCSTAFLTVPQTQAELRQPRQSVCLLDTICSPLLKKQSRFPRKYNIIHRLKYSQGPRFNHGKYH